MSGVLNEHDGCFSHITYILNQKKFHNAAGMVGEAHVNLFSNWTKYWKMNSQYWSWTCNRCKTGVTCTNLICNWLIKEQTVYISWHWITTLISSKQCCLEMKPHQLILVSVGRDTEFLPMGTMILTVTLYRHLYKGTNNNKYDPDTRNIE